jgi:hypothetical protein
MRVLDFLAPGKKDVERYTRSRDIRGLLKALKSRDIQVHNAAIAALVGIGPDAVNELLRGLKSKDKNARLGIITVLSELHDPRAVQPLIRTLDDVNSEVRWQVAIALGELGDSLAAGPLAAALEDPDKYVRYGAATALPKTGWMPADERTRARHLVGKQDWGAVVTIGKPAIPALTAILSDRDSTIRLKAIETLGMIGDTDATPALIKSLGDENRDVRWQAVLASQQCRVPLLYLPRGLTMRPKNRKSPLIAGFLNFMLPGLGYGYLGKWWGIMIFQIDITATVWLFKVKGETNSYGVLFPLYLILALHAWYLAEKMPNDPP